MITRIHKLVVFGAVIASDQAHFSPLVEPLVHLLQKKDVDFLLTKDVNVAEKHHVLCLDALVSVSMNPLALPERLSHVFNVVLH